jgi:hypothetical protein
MRKLIADKKKFSRGALLFISCLIGAELVQYFIVVERGYLGGDFYMSMPIDSSLIYSLALSIFIWIITYVLFQLTKSKGTTRINVPMTPLVLSLFIFNLIITILGNIGDVMSTTKSPISFLTTLIPINYLILVNAQQTKLNKKFFAASTILIVIDMYRLLLGAIFKLGYITLMRANRRLLIVLVLTLPLSAMMVQALVSFKFETRGASLENVEEVVVDVITSRVAILSTIHYMKTYDTNLAEYCHRVDYASPWLAAALSVIPKSIFGLDYVKTYNNCLIEFHLMRSVPDSSVNSPWIMTLYIEALSGTLNFLSYFILTAGLLFAIIKAANYLFGETGDIFKMWVIFEFMWTGNILHLTIPFYFLCLLVFYLWIKRNFLGKK